MKPKLPGANKRKNNRKSKMEGTDIMKGKYAGKGLI